MSAFASKYRRHALFGLLCLPLAALGNGLGCRQVAGIEEPAACDAVSECPEPASPCLAASCVEGACAYEAVAAGSPAPGDAVGDCKKSVCDAAGNASVEDDETDSEDGDPCTIDSCEGGVAQHQPASEVPCYTGPVGTEGEGSCQPGLAQCTDGEIGECVGQVLPAEESCDEPGDEDCDGMANEGGVGCDCEAGDTQPCYTGDPLSEGVGTCTAGTQSCNANGMGFGECTGEVTPLAMDNCTTLDDDEDCNGLPDCQGRTDWYANTVSNLDEQVKQIALAPDGKVVVLGEVKQSFVFQTETGTTLGSSDVFVAKLDAATGAIDWFTRMSSGCSDQATAMTVAPTGDVIVIGSALAIGTPCTVNGVTISSEAATLPARFYVRLGAAGNVITTRQLDLHYVNAVAASATEVFIAGARHYPTSPSQIAYRNNKYDLDGVEVPLNSWKSGEDIRALYVEGSSIWAAGQFSGTFELPNNFILTSNGGTDIFVARFTSSHSVGVAATFGGAANDRPGAIHAGPGGVYLGGEFGSPELSLGLDTLTNADPATEDAFLLRMDTALAPQASLHISGSNYQEVNSIFSSGDGLSVGGRFQNLLTISGFPGSLPSVGGYDTFVARLLPDTLKPIWRRGIGGGSDDEGAITAGPDGATYFGGRLQGPVDIDDTQPGEENPGETSAEGYVMRMAP